LGLARQLARAATAQINSPALCHPPLASRHNTQREITTGLEAWGDRRVEALLCLRGSVA